MGKMTKPAEVSPHYVANAVLLWITYIQKDLVQQKDHKTLKNQVNLFFDEKGLLRCGSQLQYAEIPYATKYPLILPRNHPLTTLFAQDSHICVCHNGVKETFTEV